MDKIEVVVVEGNKGNIVVHKVVVDKIDVQPDESEAVDNEKENETEKYVGGCLI